MLEQFATGGIGILGNFATVAATTMNPIGMFANMFGLGGNTAGGAAGAMDSVRNVMAIPLSFL